MWWFFIVFRAILLIKIATKPAWSFELMLQCAWALAEDCWKGDALSAGAAMLGLEDLEYGGSSLVLERFCSLKLQSNWLASIEMMLQFAWTPAKDCWKGDALSTDAAMLELERLEQSGRSSSFFERFRSFKLQPNRLASVEMMLWCAWAPPEDRWGGGLLSAGLASLKLEELKKFVLLQFLSYDAQNKSLWIA